LQRRQAESSPHVAWATEFLRSSGSILLRERVCRSRLTHALTAHTSLRGEEPATLANQETIDVYNSDRRMYKQARKPTRSHRLLPRTRYTAVFDQDGTDRRDAPGSDQSRAGDRHRALYFRPASPDALDLLRAILCGDVQSDPGQTAARSLTSGDIRHCNAASDGITRR